MNEISEDTWSEELNKLFSVKIQFREKLYSTEYEMEIQNLGRKKFRIRHNSSRNESLNLENCNCWKTFMGQIKLSEREFIRVANWR